MSDLPPAAAAPAAPPLSSWAVLGAAFTSPARAFAALAARPRWVLALLVLVVMAALVQVVTLRHLDMPGTVREQLAKSAAGREMSEEQLERMVAQGSKFAPVGAAVGVAASPVLLLLVAAVYFLGLKLAGSETEFKPVLAATVHAMVPPSVANSTVLALVVSQKELLTASEMSRAVKSHLTAFLSPDAPAALRGAGEVLDVFNMWMWVLLTIGLAAVGRIPRTRAATVVAVVWVGWAGLRALLASLF